MEHTTPIHTFTIEEKFFPMKPASAWNETGPACLECHDYPVVFYAILLPIFLIGIAGNSLLIFIIARHRKMRTVPNRYIFNLSVANVLLTITLGLAPLLVDPQADPLLNSPVCVIAHAVREITTCVSVFTLTALSAERYHAIVYPLRRNSGMSASTVTTAVVAGVWTFSVIIVLVKFIISHNGNTTCIKCGPMFDTTGFETGKYTFAAEFFVFYLTPLMTIAVFYILMAQELYFTSVRFADDSIYSSHVDRMMQVRKKIACSVLAMIAMFAASFLPLYSLRLSAFIFDFNLTHWGRVATLVFCWASLYSCANPVILYFTSDSCRSHFKYYFLNWICWQKYPLPVENESSGFIPTETLNDAARRVHSTSV